ncbi:MAG: hypothetical protein SLAVMIC_00811 [uncultured marine phage]|uniref:Uncharacterized protein n=1 Tax=uncultured marine phage TaxID=707152 RepID=A0A8D9CCR5_9VIRU|nr:MAG: hypothetical protein SLAVMIC_00811 [uncultured marine phage]
MICHGISFVKDGGSIKFACTEKEIGAITKDNIHTEIMWFTLDRSIGSENSGRYKMYIGDDPKTAEWIDDEGILSELSESIRNYVNDQKAKYTNDPVSWYDTDRDMKILTRIERLYKLTKDKDESTKDN